MTTGGTSGPERTGAVRARTPGEAATPSMRGIRRSLRRVRERARAVLTLRATARILVLSLALMIVFGVIDFAVRLPAGFRTATLLLTLGVVGVWFARELLPALRFRPSLTQIALRLERINPTQTGLRDLLAAGLDLERGPAEPDAEADEQRRRVVARAHEAFTSARLVRPYALRTLARPAGLLAAGLVAAAVFAAATPDLASIWVARLLTPWSEAEWPRRTELADGTPSAVHPRDSALPLRASLLRSPRAPEATRVVAVYRHVDSAGNAGPERRTLLTQQASRIDAEGRASGTPFERLLEPAALRAPQADAEADRWLEYHFESGDGRTPTRRIRLVERPRLASASAGVSPPDYAAGAGSPLASGEIPDAMVGVGRIEVRRVLAGSGVEIRLAFNKAVSVELGEDSTAAGGLSIGAEGPLVTISGEPGADRRVDLVVRDEHGLSPRERLSLAIGVIEDEAPQATVTSPSRDESYLPSARVELEGEGRDDLGLRLVALERQLAFADASSMGAAPEPTGDYVRIAEVVFDEPGGAPLERTAAVAFELSELSVGPGDEVWVTTLAADWNSAAGADGAVTRSSVRRLRVIDEAAFIEQIRSGLSGARRVIQQLDTRQRDLQASEAEGTALEQATLTRRIDRQRDAIAEAAERVRENRLEDASLTGLLADAGPLLAEAARASASAADELDAADDPDQAERERSEAAQRAAEQQRRVRESLGRVLELLDRGEDGWLVRRSLERLLSEQGALNEASSELGEQTVGRSLDQLDPDERSELQRLAERQAELARQARDTLDDLAERANQLEETDPAQASAMREAARQGQQAEVEQRLEDAAQRLSQNQSSAAQDQQQQATEALEQMLEELDQAERNRDRALQRELASLIETLDALIRRQTREIGRVQAAQQGEAIDAGALADAMIALHTATLAAADQASGGFGELAPIQRLILEAAEAQVRAVRSLRREEPDLARAQGSEEAALNLLMQARDEAEREREQAENREAERARAELRAAYREALEEQVALRGEAERFAGERLSRRERAEVRGIGQRQESLRERVADVLREYEELTESGVMTLAHDQLDSAMGSAGALLGRGEADSTVLRHQTLAVEILASLVEALAPQPQRPDDGFEDQGGGGGGGGGQQQTPPLVEKLAELKVLRAMQQQALVLTRAVDEGESVEAAARDSVATLQGAITQRATELIESLQQNRPQVPLPEGDAVDPDKPSDEEESGGGS